MGFSTDGLLGASLSVYCADMPQTRSRPPETDRGHGGGEHCPECGHEATAPGRLTLLAEKWLRIRVHCLSESEDAATGWGDPCGCTHAYHRR